MTDSLSDRLKALGFIPAVKLEKPAVSPPELDFGATLQAQKIANSLGSTHLVENHYPLDYRHGSVSFNTTTEITSLSTAARVQTAEGTDLRKLLFLDTETTGLSGGTGTFAFLVGVGAFSADGFVLKQYILKDPSEEAAMLLEILRQCDEYTGIVTYNGKGFDIPLLRSRLVLNRLPNPFGTMAHFDLLFLARKIWRNRLPSRTLQDLEQAILQIPRSDDEIPGWMIPQMYFDFLRNGDPRPLKGIVYHNGMDILSLAALFLYLSTSFENIQNVEQFDPIDYYSLGQLFLDLGYKDIAQKILLECDRQDRLPYPLKLALFQHLGELYKGQQDFSNAVFFWQRAAEFENTEASIELAKYYEHVARDYSLAQGWTETAIASLAKRGYHTYQDRKLGKELIKRKDRLSHRLERKNGYVPEKT